MSFTPDFLDEIRTRVSLTDLVGRRVSWDRHKSNARRKDFWGCCPFHHEKTPSFHVDEPRGFYHCFGCGAHGNLFDFMMQMENLNFPEAVERLAHDAGLKMPERSPEMRAQEKKRATLYDVMEVASTFYQNILRSPEGQEPRSYLEGRGMGPTTWETFGIGYAPSGRTALVDHLIARDIKMEQITEAGLALKSDYSGKYQDRFRERVMFPITNSRGQTIAFGGRAMSAQAKAKYMNSPETPLFHKGKALYNFQTARSAAQDVHRNGGGKVPALVIAEGYVDVIALSRAGFPQSVAPLGTALTEDQIGLAWRLTPEPVLCFDGDEAGLKAAYRAIDAALPLLKAGHSLRFALLPSGLDPDDLIREKGADAMSRVLAQAIPLIDLLWQREIEQGPFETPERKAQFERQLEVAVQSIRDGKVQSFYRQAVRDRMFQLFSGHRTGSSGGRKGQKPYKSGFSQGANAPVSQALRQSTLVQASRLAGGIAAARDGDLAVERERALVFTVLNHPEILERHGEAFADLLIERPELDRLRAEILEVAASGAALDRAGLRNHLEKRGAAHLADQLERQKSVKLQRFASADAELSEAEENWFHILSIHNEFLLLQREAREAEAAYHQDMSEENWRRLQSIQRQLKETSVAQVGDG